MFFLLYLSLSPSILKKNKVTEVIFIQLKLVPHIPHTSLELSSKITLKGHEGIQIQGFSCLPHLDPLK